MKRQSLSKNFIYQFLYQGVILIIPLILSPYLTRTLQETSLGVFSFVNSIAYYFIVLANLGITRHGQRIISQNADDEIELRTAFWSLFYVHLFVSLISIVAYAVFVIVFVREDNVIYWIELVYVTSALFDITWLFYGLENFKSVVIKNLAVKILECGTIMLLVKHPGDLWIYTLITSVALLAGQAVMIPQAIRIVKPIHVDFHDCKQHVKPLLLFSISVIAATLYTVFDKTLLGILSSKESVAFYEYSNKIINIPKTIVGVIGTVMFPRACKMAAEGDIEGQKRYINYSFEITAFIGMGAIFGLLAVSKLFATIYYGEAFSICGTVIMALSPLIYIIGIGDIIRTQFMIPNGMDKQFTVCIILNAILNLILSIALIPVVGIFGAVIGTVSAEVFGIIYQMYLCRKNIHFYTIFSTAIPYVFSGLIMYMIVKYIGNIVSTNIIGLLIQIAVGGVCYTLLSAICFLLRHKKFLNKRNI